MEAERWQQIEALYHQALDRPTAEREGFLTRACAGDTLLKEEVVTLLLSHEAATGAFLEFPAMEAAARLEASQATTITEAVGDGPALASPRHLIGQYQLLGELGRGGMGAVYLARRADDQYRKQVAIKLIRGGANSDEIIRRFRNERQILAELDHPNIARFLEGGATADGRPYFVMEHIVGQPIVEYCDARRLAIDERLRLFRDVCSAVHYAHQRLVIHRDIKPTNILVTEDGAVKLLDFGIAKLLDTELMDQTVETATEARMMTPEYASPEQIRGERVTTTTDVYSLGMVLYELLSGHRPYKFERRSWEEIERVVCRQEPMRLSAALAGATVRNPGKETRPMEPETRDRTRGETLRSLQRHLAKDLDNIVMMALRKEPERRYSSVEQLSEDLRRYLEGLPVSARPNTLGYRAGKFFRRNKPAVAAAALMLVTLLAATTVAAWQARTARRERDKAEQRFNQVRKLANAVLFKYHDGVEKLAGSTSVREMMVKDALEYLDNLSRESGARAGGNDLSLLDELDEAYEKVGKVQGAPAQNSLGDYAGALVSQRKALAIRESLTQGDPKNEARNRALAKSYLLVGQLLMQSGQTPEALDHLQKARALLEKLTTENPTNFNARGNLQTAYTLIGSIRQSQNDLPGALELFRKTLAQAEEDTIANPNDLERRRDLTVAHIYVGDAFYGMNNLTEAISHHRKALAVSETLAAADPTNAQLRRDVCVALQRLASSQERAGDLRSALENYRKVETLDEQAAAADPANALTRRDLLVSHLKIGRTLAALGEMGPALVYLRKMATLAESLATDPSNTDANTEARSDLSIAHYTIGETLAKKGDLREALQSFHKSLAIDEALAAQDKTDTYASSSIAHNHRAISDVLFRLKNLTGAEEGYRKALDIYTPLAAEDPTDETVQRDLALAHEGLGNVAISTMGNKIRPEQLERWRDARDHYQQSLAVWRDLGKRNALRVADARKPEEVAQKLTRCDTALAKIKAR